MSGPYIPGGDHGLCPECNQWCDYRGHLRGWAAADGSDRFRKLPPGHMPPDYHHDAATGWIPMYSNCVGEVRP